MIYGLLSAACRLIEGIGEGSIQAACKLINANKHLIQIPSILYQILINS